MGCRGAGTAVGVAVLMDGEQTLTLRPPQDVKTAVESICDILGEGELEWKEMRGVIMRENFISSIVNYDAENMS